MSPSSDNGQANIFTKILRTIVGAPKHFKDPHLFHKMTLIPILAWVGLGADGLSSSSYGPEEAFRALGSHSRRNCTKPVGTWRSLTRTNGWNRKPRT